MVAGLDADGDRMGDAGNWHRGLVALLTIIVFVSGVMSGEIMALRHPELSVAEQGLILEVHAALSFLCASAYWFLMTWRRR